MLTASEQPQTEDIIDIQGKLDRNDSNKVLTTITWPYRSDYSLGSGIDENGNSFDRSALIVEDTTTLSSASSEARKINLDNFNLGYNSSIFVSNHEKTDLFKASAEMSFSLPMFEVAGMAEYVKNQRITNNSVQAFITHTYLDNEPTKLQGKIKGLNAAAKAYLKGINNNDADKSIDEFCSLFGHHYVGGYQEGCALMGFIEIKSDENTNEESIKGKLKGAINLIAKKISGEITIDEYNKKVDFEFSCNAQLRSYTGRPSAMQNITTVEALFRAFDKYAQDNTKNPTKARAQLLPWSSLDEFNQNEVTLSKLQERHKAWIDKEKNVIARLNDSLYRAKIKKIYDEWNANLYRTQLSGGSGGASTPEITFPMERIQSMTIWTHKDLGFLKKINIVWSNGKEKTFGKDDDISDKASYYEFAESEIKNCFFSASTYHGGRASYFQINFENNESFKVGTIKESIVPAPKLYGCVLVGVKIRHGEEIDSLQFIGCDAGYYFGGILPNINALRRQYNTDEINVPTGLRTILRPATTSSNISATTSATINPLLHMNLNTDNADSLTKKQEDKFYFFGSDRKSNKK